MAKKKGQQKVKVVVQTAKKKKGSKKSKNNPMNVIKRPPIYLNASVHKICDISNPFCPGAVGGKWPDGAATKSITWSVNASPTTQSTDVNGYSSSLYLADFGGQYLTGSTTTYPTVTYNGASTFSAFIGAPTSARWRLTSWGIKVNCSGAMNTTQGIVRVRLFSPLSGTALTSVNYVNTLADAMIDIPCARLIGQDLFILPQPMGLVQPRTFQDTRSEASTLNTWKNPGWQCINVAVDGGIASAVVLQVAAFYHFEYVADDSDTNFQFATPAPKTDLAAQAANSSVLDQVGNFVSGGIDKVGRFFQSSAGAAVSGAAAGYFTRSPSTALTVYQGVRGASRRHPMDVD